MNARRQRLAAAGLALLLPLSAAAACPPEGYTRAALDALKANDFTLAEADARQSLALALTDCLGDPDPALRDGIAFEALSHWLRADALRPDTVQALRASLLGTLHEPDPDGYARPFAVLSLSEVARADRIKPLFTPAQRAELVTAAADFLRGLRDYRGYVDGEGWRHGVAHGADLVLQLALNPAVDAGQLRTLLDAVAAQIAPPQAPAYSQGESLRLARAVYYAAARGVLDAAYWQQWLDRVSAPTPLPDWAAAFNSEAGLRQRHNTLAFLTGLYFYVGEGGNAAASAALQAPLRAALERVP